MPDPNTASEDVASVRDARVTMSPDEVAPPTGGRNPMASISKCFALRRLPLQPWRLSMWPPYIRHAQCQAPPLIELVPDEAGTSFADRAVRQFSRVALAAGAAASCQQPAFGARQVGEYASHKA